MIAFRLWLVREFEAHSMLTLSKNPWHLVVVYSHPLIPSLFRRINTSSEFIRTRLSRYIILGRDGHRRASLLSIDSISVVVCIHDSILLQSCHANLSPETFIKRPIEIVLLRNTVYLVRMTHV